MIVIDFGMTVKDGRFYEEVTYAEASFEADRVGGYTHVKAKRVK
jgi:hypothetical protein